MDAQIEKVANDLKLIIRDMQVHDGPCEWDHADEFRNYADRLKRIVRSLADGPQKGKTK